MNVALRTALLFTSLLPLAAPAMAQSAPAAAATAAATAAAPALKRTEVYRGQVADPGREAVLMKVELAPNAQAGRHSHPGDEVSYVVEGETELLIDGQPARRLKAGEGFSVPAGTVHDARNVGNGPVHLIGVYLVEKGKPLATPAK